MLVHGSSMPGYLISILLSYYLILLFLDVHFLPISGLVGSNMKTRVDKSVCSWWNGPCLFEVLDGIEVPLRDPKGPVRLGFCFLTSVINHHLKRSQTNATVVVIVYT